MCKFACQKKLVYCTLANFSWNKSIKKTNTGVHSTPHPLSYLVPGN